jgi:NAD(P)-dependent dehydrogenase (short-subunit alcohol dehydrogenase family)
MEHSGTYVGDERWLELTPAFVSRLQHSLLLVLCLLVPCLYISARIFLALPYMRRRRIRRALSGKHVWITGGSQGLGFSIALIAFRAGALVTITGRSSRRLEEAAGAIDGSVRCVTADVGGDAQAFRAAYARVTAPRGHGHGHGHGPVDVAIANAGINHAGRPFQSLTDGEIENVLATNLLGVARMFACVLPSMRSHGHGALCAVSSLAAYRGLPGTSIYGASKAGVTSLCQSLAVELVRTGVSVTCVHPGFVDTPAIAGLDHSKPFQMAPDDAAELVLDAIACRATSTGFPWIMAQVVMRLSCAMPSPLYEWVLHLGSSASRANDRYSDPGKQS